METPIGWIVYVMIFSMLFILIIFHYFSTRNDITESYIFNIKKKRIDWIKVLRIYIIANIFTYVSSINNEMMNYTDVFLIPIVLISFLLTYWFVYPDPDKRREELENMDKEEFDRYKKSKEREEKINKILK